MNTLPNELYQNVFNHLRPIDLVVFAQTNSRNNIITNNELTIKFEKWDRLKAFFINPKAFVQLFNQNCLISGSILVQFLLNESYNGDIDIYLTKSEVSGVKEFLKSEGFTFGHLQNQYGGNKSDTTDSNFDLTTDDSSSDNSSDVSSDNFSSDNSSDFTGPNFTEYRDNSDTSSDVSSETSDSSSSFNDLSPTNSTYIINRDNMISRNVQDYDVIIKKEQEYFSVETFSKQCNQNKDNYTICKVQLIITNDPIDRIKKFDFNIVKNYYDGKNLYFSKSLLNKTEELSFYQLQNLTFTQKDRMAKYISRGFKFLINRL